ncbi:unnamed protein product [Closterium sp. NIES-53]
MRGSSVQSPHTAGKNAHDAVLKAASLTSSVLLPPNAPRLPVFADVDVSQYVLRHRGRRVEAENAARQSDLQSLCPGIRRYQLPGNGGGQQPGNGGGHRAPTNASPTICAVAVVAAPTPSPVNVLRAGSTPGRSSHSAAAASSTGGNSSRLSPAGSALAERAQSEGKITVTRDNASCSSRHESSAAVGLLRQVDDEERSALTTRSGIIPSLRPREDSAAAVTQCRPVNPAGRPASITTCASRQPRSGTCRKVTCAGGRAVGLVRAAKAEMGEEGEGKQDDGEEGEAGEEDDDVVLALPVDGFRGGVIGAAPGEWDSMDGRTLLAREAVKGWRGRAREPGGRACDAGDEDEVDGDVVTCKPVEVRVTCFTTPVIRRRVSRSAGGKLSTRGAAGGRKAAAQVAGGPALGRMVRRSTAEGATLPAGREGSETGGSNVGRVPPGLLPPVLVHKGMVLCDGAEARCETGREGQEERREVEAQDRKGLRRQADEASAQSERSEQAARAERAERAEERVRGREEMAAEEQESREAADVARGEDEMQVGAVSVPSSAVSVPSRAVSGIEEGRIREQLRLIAEAVERRAGQEEVRSREEGRNRGEGWAREEVRHREEMRIREEGRFREEGRIREEERIRDQLQLTQGVEEEGENRQQAGPHSVQPDCAYLAKPSAYLGTMDALSWQDLYVDCDVADLWQEALGSSQRANGLGHASAAAAAAAPAPAGAVGTAGATFISAAPFSSPPPAPAPCGPHDRWEQHSQRDQWGRSIH